MRKNKYILKIIFISLCLIDFKNIAYTAPEDTPMPSLPFINAIENPGETALVLQIILLLTILSLAPSILIMLTSFTRTIIMLFARNGMGVQQVPPQSY